MTLRRAFAATTCCCAFLLASAVGADSPAAPDGQILLRSAYDQRRVQTGRARAKMVLIDGDRRWEREAVLYSKQLDSDRRVQRVTFETPPDLAGSSVLTHDEAGADSAQWVYVPAYHSVRRIPPTSRGDMYLGTDYAYEDLLELRWGDYTFAVTGEESLAKARLVRVAISPRPGAQASTAYGKRVFWIEPVRKVIVREEFYDGAGGLLKRLTNSQLRQYGRYWLWDRAVMDNLRTGHKTTTEVVSRDVDAGLADDIFTVKALKRSGSP
jgi:uncharacterized protein